MISIKHVLIYLIIYTRLLSGSSHNHNQFTSYMPVFEKQVIKEHSEDTYWIEAFQPDSNTPIGFIAYGIADGSIKFYPNPYNLTKHDIEPIRIQKLLTPIGMDQADISGDGFNDIVICFDYGNTTNDFNADGGRIVWLENPGHDFHGKVWQPHYVGRSPTMHRLKVGHFTQTQYWEIIGLPIVSGPYHASVPVLLFREPENIFNAQAWHQDVINQNYFHLIHDAAKFSIQSLDNLLIASQEGLTWLYYDEHQQKWMIENIAEGEQNQKQQTNFFGSGGVSVGKIGNDPFAYLAAVEPFHGNIVSVYLKSTNNNSLTNIQWQRHILDIYGHPDQHGEGTSHYIVCADFDQDGDDEFLVALRGPYPSQGVYYYKLMDPINGMFTKWKVSDDSTARIAIADYDQDGYLDFSTVSYSVQGYYLAEKTPINVFYNRMVDKRSTNSSQIQVKKENDELLFYIARTEKTQQYYSMPFLSIGHINLSLEILPPFSSRQINHNTYIKVLSGKIIWTGHTDRSNQTMKQSRTFLCEPKSVCSLAIHSDDQRIKTEHEGAIFIVMQTSESGNMNDDTRLFDRIENILLTNLLANDSHEEVRQHHFQFIRVDQLNWDKIKFKGLEFYTMRVADIRFEDNNEQLCHLQLWAASTGTNAGVHNHVTDRFCEVHACIINSNGNSGMHYLENSDRLYDPLMVSDSEFIHLEMPSFSEHGPLWDLDSKNRPIFREDSSIVYPWHKWQSGTNRSIAKKPESISPLKDLVPSLSQRKLEPSFDVWIAFEYNPKLAAFSQQ